MDGNRLFSFPSLNERNNEMEKLNERTDESNELPIAVIIGDNDGIISQSLLGNESIQNGLKNELLLDTKYYTASLKLVTVDCCESAIALSNNNSITALIYCFKNELNSVNSLQLLASSCKSDVQIVICDRIEQNNKLTDELLEFCAAEHFDVIEMDPSNETIEELNDCCELYGVQRIRQVLESANWHGRTIKENPLKKREHFQRMVEFCDGEAGVSRVFGPIDEIDAEIEKITDEDRGIIIDMFGGERLSFEDIDMNSKPTDSDVLKYFKQEMGQTKKSGKSSKKKKLKSKVNKCGNKFGEFVDAQKNSISSITEKGRDVILRNEVSGDLQTRRENNQNSQIDEKETKTESLVFVKAHKKALIGVDPYATRKDTPADDKKKITNLVTKLDQARSTLSKMSFGPDRQNLAADTMIEMMYSLGVDDSFYTSSSDDESIIRTKVS